MKEDYKYMNVIKVFSCCIEGGSIYYSMQDLFLKMIVVYLAGIVLVISLLFILLKWKDNEKRQWGVSGAVQCLLVLLVVSIFHINNTKKPERYRKLIGQKVLVASEDSVLMRKAEVNFDLMAQLDLATRFQRDSNLLKRDYKQAEKWLLMAISQNSPQAYNSLADMYYYGEGRKVNYNTAYHYYCKAFLAGDRAYSVRIIPSLEEEKQIKVDSCVSRQVRNFVYDYNHFVGLLNKYTSTINIDTVKQFARKGIYPAYDVLISYYLAEKKDRTAAKYWAEEAIKAGYTGQIMVVLAEGNPEINPVMKEIGEIQSNVVFASYLGKEEGEIFSAYKFSKRAYLDAQRLYAKDRSDFNALYTLNLTKETYDQVRMAINQILASQKTRLVRRVANK